MIVYFRKLVSPSSYWCKLLPQHCHLYSQYSILTFSWWNAATHTKHHLVHSPIWPSQHLSCKHLPQCCPLHFLENGDHSDFFLFLYSCLISSVQSEVCHYYRGQQSCRLLQLGCERRLFPSGSYNLFSIFFIESQSKHFNELYIFITYLELELWRQSTNNDWHSMYMSQDRKIFLCH